MNRQERLRKAQEFFLEIIEEASEMCAALYEERITLVVKHSEYYAPPSKGTLHERRNELENLLEKKGFLRRSDGLALCTGNGRSRSSRKLHYEAQDFSFGHVDGGHVQLNYRTQRLEMPAPRSNMETILDVPYKDIRTTLNSLEVRISKRGESTTDVIKEANRMLRQYIPVPG